MTEHKGKSNTTNNSQEAVLELIIATSKYEELVLMRKKLSNLLTLVDKRLVLLELLRKMRGDPDVYLR